MDRYICIHGHFYQPPRENPWLESIELQDLAHPYHDWNERITAECYAPNWASRLLNSEGLITDIINNYAKMSFNFGPTLLSWMETKSPDVYQAIIRADKESTRNFSGHGSALAQVYNHMILPLANSRDKYTQILWGISDFERRFNRKAEGMWLSETAVDIETLEILAELGIIFTILSPRQAGRVKGLHSRGWQNVSNGTVDTTLPYKINLPSGRSVTVFFYDDQISHAVAFEGLLSKGELFAEKLMGGFSGTRTGPQLVNIATDGETYGHHHRFGDMALAYAIRYIETNNLARITNYGEFLEKNPPSLEAEIIENTSWSCVHGIERWRSDCGCSSGLHKGWSQSWRAPLRDTLDWLRDALVPNYEKKSESLLRDPWKARNDYISVVNNRSIDSVEKFFSQHASGTLSEIDKVTILKLMELQRHAMLMYTSCGWFFDDLWGIETVQVIQYAGRAIQLAEDLFGENLETKLLDLLDRAKSNSHQSSNGRVLYEEFVKPAMIDLKKVAAHYAISSLFEKFGGETNIFSYNIDIYDYQHFEAGKARLATGLCKVSSTVTWESSIMSFAVMHFGDHNLNAGVHENKIDKAHNPPLKELNPATSGDKAYQLMVKDLNHAFSKAEFTDVIRRMDKHFGDSNYSLRNLFRDRQRNVLGHILESTLGEVEASYRQVYDQNYPLMRFLIDLGNPLPQAFRAAAEFVLNLDITRALSGNGLDIEHIKELLNNAREWNIAHDASILNYLYKNSLEKLMENFRNYPDDTALQQRLVDAVELARTAPFEVDLWKVQNIYFEMFWENYPGIQRKAKKGDKLADDWLTFFISLGEDLSMQLPRLLA